MSEVPSPAPSPLHIAILSGGDARRMRSGQPKALHEVFFRPMIHYVLDAAAAVEHRSLSLVVGRDEREFREQCRGYAGLLIVRQAAPLGDADAVRALEPSLGGQEGNALIVAGDAVLLTPNSLRGLVEKHSRTGADCTVGRDVSGSGEGVVYCFRIPLLFDTLKRLDPGGTENEFRLSDAVSELAARGAAINEYPFADPLEAIDVNDLYALWRVETALQERFNRELMLKGVAIEDPRTTFIDPRCRIDRGVRIENGCRVINSALAAGVVVESFCRISDSEIGPGSRLCQGACVEAARIGRNVVLGCGFITCSSSDRPPKQKTIIEDDVFVGGASHAIAPVTVGAGSFIATGTSVTEDVPPGSFVISRGHQVTKAGYVKKHGKSKGPLASR